MSSAYRCGDRPFCSMTDTKSAVYKMNRMSLSTRLVEPHDRRTDGLSSASQVGLSATPSMPKLASPESLQQLNATERSREILVNISFM